METESTEERWKTGDSAELHTLIDELFARVEELEKQVEELKSGRKK